MRRALILLCFVLSIGVFCQMSYADDEPRPTNVIIVSVPGLSFDHLEDTTSCPQLRRLLDEGHLGAMNLRTAGSDTLANSYATLAAGRRVSVPESESFYQVGEMFQGRPVSDWIRERIGKHPRTGAVYPTLVPYGQKNRDIHEAMLGEVMRRAGMQTAVWGNADWGEENVRFAPFLSMNRYGHTADAVIDEQILTSAEGFPYGIKTNYAYLLEQITASPAELRVVELGDLYRLQREAAMMTEARVQSLEQQILQDLDRFLAQLSASLSPYEVMWLISPYIQPSDSKHKVQLAPSVWLGQDEQGGLLYSPTTRRSGIVANVDLAPTVLQSLGLGIPESMDGQPVEVTGGDVDSLWAVLEQVVTVYRLRPLMIYTYALYQVATLMIALGLLLSKKKRGTGLLQMALLASILTPVLFLLLAAVPTQSYALFFVLWVGIAVLAASLLQKLPTVPLFLGLGCIGFVPIIVDGLLGGYLIRQSFLGYDPIIGARYYGIGNEYMGVVIGAVLLMVAAWLEWKRPEGRWVKAGTAILFGLLILYFAAPFWGTNAGGALAASVGFGVAYARFFYNRVDWRFWLAVVALGMVGIGLLFTMNVLFAVDAQSHIGRAFDHLLSGDFAEIVDIASRKLATNIRLIKASLWGKVFFISLLAMTVLIIQPLRGVRWLQMRYPYLFHGFTAIVISALSALVFNDSGIVSAATAIVYVVIPLLIIVSRDWIPEPEGIRISSKRR